MDEPKNARGGGILYLVLDVENPYAGNNMKILTSKWLDVICVGKSLIGLLGFAYYPEHMKFVYACYAFSFAASRGI